MAKKQASKRSADKSTLLFGIGAVVVFAGVVVGGILLSNITTSANDEFVAKTLPVRTTGNCSGSWILKSKIDGPEHVDCEGQTHVADGTRVTYKNDPPISGDHWAGPTPPGFYKLGEQEAYWLPERLVHSLEHGNIVIYYDPDKVTAQQQADLANLSKRYAGGFSGVISAPRKDEKNPIVLTAWEWVWRLPAYDKANIDRFIREFVGNGPENQKTAQN